MLNRKGRPAWDSLNCWLFGTCSIASETSSGSWDLAVHLSGVSHGANANQRWSCGFSVLLSPQMSAEPGGSNLVPLENLAGKEDVEG